MKWIGATLLLLATTPCGLAQDATALKTRLESAQQRSSLEDAALKPWHLKLTVHLFNEKGKPTGDGTIEEWWISPGHDRREYNAGAYKATELRDDDKQYRTKGAGTPPYLLSLLRDQAVKPIALEKEDSSHAELRKETIGKIPLECIMLSQPIKRLAFAPLGLFPTYCFEPGKDDLRLSFEFGNQTIVRNRIGTFQNRAVGTQVSVLSGTGPVATSEVVKLETFTPSGDELAASGEIGELRLSPVKVSSGAIAGKAISQPQPVYPATARANRVTGTVVLHAIIGTDGHVHSLRIISAPDPDLAISAIAAVRNWTYSAYTLMGAPVDVETTINVNYTMQ